jgi:starch-binding outer membrane protein, SusD/RagB family
MKKLFYIILLFNFSLLWNACTKTLEEHRLGATDPGDYFNNKAEGEAAIFGAYAYMAGYEDYGNDIQMSIGARDDQQKIAYAGDHMNMDLILPVTGYNEKDITQWTRIYSEISCANNAIDGIPRIPPSKISEADRKALIAEAKTVRAFNYFRLVRMYGAVPYIDEFVTDPAAVKSATRMSTDDIYTNIIADLEESKDLLPDKYDQGSTPVRSRVSKGTAYTILADVYLTRQDWTQAALNAKYVIDNASSFGYSLMPDFKQAFNFFAGNDCNEYVWSCDFKSGDDGYSTGRDQLAELCGLPSWFGWAYGGWATVYASAQSLNDFNIADYRRKVTFYEDAPDQNGVMHHYDEATKPFPQSCPAVAKIYWSFVGTNRQDNAYNTDMNWPVYRYAEVLLIAAEAENELNGPAGAYQYINQVRARARNFDGVVGSSLIPADLSGLTKDQFRDAVILERKVELAFEFKRWFDITRLNLTLSTVFGPSGTDPLPNSGQITQSYKLLPIPQADIDINPNLAIPVQ